MKKIKSNVDRYDIGGGYILEAWTEETSDGVLYDFYLQKRGAGYKMSMFGWPANQPNAVDGHTTWTKAEAVELAAANAPDYIEIYEEETQD